MNEKIKELFENLFVLFLIFGPLVGMMYLDSKYGKHQTPNKNNETQINRALDPLTPGFLLSPEENLTRFVLTGEDAYDD